MRNLRLKQKRARCLEYFTWGRTIYEQKLYIIKPTCDLLPLSVWGLFWSLITFFFLRPLFRKLFFFLLEIYIKFDFYSFWDCDPILLATRTLSVKNEPVFSPFSSIFDGQFWNLNNFLSSRLFSDLFFLSYVKSTQIMFCIVFEMVTPSCWPPGQILWKICENQLFT